MPDQNRLCEKFRKDVKAIASIYTTVFSLYDDPLDRLCLRLEKTANKHTSNCHDELLEALKSLADCGDKVVQELCDQDTGWYYQFKAALSKAEQTIVNAERGE